MKDAGKGDALERSGTEMLWELIFMEELPGMKSCGIHSSVSGR